METRGGAKIGAAGDEGDALKGVVVGDAKMVAGRRILAGEHRIAEGEGIAGHAAFAFLEPGEGAGEREGGSGIQTEGMGLHRVDGPVAAGAGIERAFRAVRCGYGGGDVGAGAGAGIQHAEGGEAVEGFAVVREMSGLVTNRGFPFEAEPAEVILESGRVFGAAAGRVDVLDAEEETTADRFRTAPGDQGGVGAAEVEQACRARGEAGYKCGCQRGDRHGAA